MEKKPSGVDDSVPRVKTKKRRHALIFIGLTFITVTLLGLGVMWLHDPFPVNTGEPRGREAFAAWWEQPAALTADEVAAQQWLADVTCRLPPAEEEAVWQVGGSQHGVFAIRYQAAFAGYAAAALGMRTPAYIGLTQAILSNTVSRLADKKAWSYIQTYWSREPWFPDPCAKGNVMYTGHLMQLMALEEALSGDPRYNRDGVGLAWDEAHRFSYTTRRLAEVTTAQMRAGPGGVSCEPGLVFFACNNHPQITFRLLEGMGYGDWRAESAKWERWSLRRFRATAGGGAFRILHHDKSGLAYPRGMPGFDGWSLLWYAPWARDRANLQVLWGLAQKTIAWDEYGNDPGESHDAPIQASCCNPVPIQVPPAATASFLRRRRARVATATPPASWRRGSTAISGRPAGAACGSTRTASGAPASTPTARSLWRRRTAPTCGRWCDGRCRARISTACCSPLWSLPTRRCSKPSATPRARWWSSSTAAARPSRWRWPTRAPARPRSCPKPLRAPGIRGPAP